MDVVYNTLYIENSYEHYVKGEQKMGEVRWVIHNTKGVIDYIHPYV